MASTSSTTRYLRRVLHKDDILLDNNNIFNEHNNISEGVDITNHGDEQQSPKIQSDEKQNYNKSMWDLGNLSPSILFAEAAVVTLIVGTILICCLQRHKRRLLNQQREQLRAMQEWATIRIPSTNNHHQDGNTIGTNGTVATQQEYMDESRRSIISSILDVSNGQVSNNNASPSRRGRVRVDSNISGILSRMNAEGTVDIDGRRRRMDSGISGIISLEESIGRRRRGRVDSGISGMYSVRSSSVGQQQQPVTGNQPTEQEEVNQTPLRRTLRTLSLIPRALGNLLLYPLRSLESGVNNWATSDYDREFLRQFMEQVELEREAALEPGEERELRLKEAFSKGGMVWELDDEHFFPPKDDLLDNNLGGEKLDDIEEGNVYDADDQEEGGGGTSEDVVNHGLISLGAQANHHLGGKSKDDIGNQENEAGVVREEVSAVMELLLQNIQDRDCNREEEIEEDTSLMAGDEYTMGGVSLNAAMIPERPSSSPPQLMGGGGASSSTLSSHSSSSAINIIEESPSFLYLKTAGPGRRRVNTSGSLDTSANNQTASSETINEIKDLIKESDISSEKADDLIAQYEGREDKLLKNLRRMPPLMGRPRSSSLGSVLSSQASAHNKVPNECAICLSGYEKGETIVTSYNGECPHAFHQECIVEWLVKMQDGAPCPCCRRTFIDLDAHAPPRSGGTPSRGGNNNSNANNNVQQDPEEAERQRLERRRRRIEQGIQRGGRTFNTGIISLR